MAENAANTNGISCKGSLKQSEITDKIIREFFSVYNELGAGFLESVYEEALCFAMTQAGLAVQRQVPIPVWFRGHKVGDFRADLLVNGTVLVELKVAKTLDSSHCAQLIHYLKATRIEVGILLNFGTHPEFKRFVFANERKKIRENPRESAVGGTCA